MDVLCIKIVDVVETVTIHVWLYQRLAGSLPTATSRNSDLRHGRGLAGHNWGSFWAPYTHAYYSPAMARPHGGEDAAY